MHSDLFFYLLYFFLWCDRFFWWLSLFYWLHANPFFKKTTFPDGFQLVPILLAPRMGGGCLRRCLIEISRIQSSEFFRMCMPRLRCACKWMYVYKYSIFVLLVWPMEVWLQWNITDNVGQGPITNVSLKYVYTHNVNTGPSKRHKNKQTRGILSKTIYQKLLNYFEILYNSPLTELSARLVCELLKYTRYIHV